MSRASTKLDRVPDITVVSDVGTLSRRRGRATVIYDPQVLALNPWLREAVERWFECELLVAIQGGEPTAESIEGTAAEARAAGSDVIVSVGGGSTIDTAKGVALLALGATRLPREFAPNWEVGEPKPHVAIPTTAGPGAEASPAIVYGLVGANTTVCAHRALIPREVVICGAVGSTLPRWLNATCILDGVAHSVECLLSADCPGLAQELCGDALLTFGNALERIDHAPDDVDERERLAIASIMSASGLRLAGVHAVHALARGLAEGVQAPHSLLVSLCLTAMMRLLPSSSWALMDSRLAMRSAVHHSQLRSCVEKVHDTVIAPEIARHILVRNGCGVEACATVAKNDPRWARSSIQLNGAMLERLFRYLLSEVLHLPSGSRLIGKRDRGR